jgi:MFS family permease
MGIVIAGLSVGSMVGIAAGGGFVARSGARACIAASLTAVVVGTLVIAAGASTGQAWLVTLGLAVVGFGMGAGEIAFNVEGVAIEAVTNTTVVPSLHGSYSAGLCVGAVLGLLANGSGFPVMAHLVAVAVLTAGSTVWLVRNLPHATGRESRGPADQGIRDSLRGSAAVWREGRTVAIGVIVLGMAFAEGSANDWLPLIVVDGFGLSATTGSLLYALFGASMALGRFCGGRFLDCYGRTPVLRVSAGFAVVGIGLVAFAPTIYGAGIGVVLWGLGAALGFPVALSAAGDNPEGAARRVSAVATAGYAAFLVGPPILGFIGQHVGLRVAILLVLVLVAVSACFAGWVRRPSPDPGRAESTQC